MVFQWEGFIESQTIEDEYFVVMALHKALQTYLIDKYTESKNGQKEF